MQIEIRGRDVPMPEGLRSLIERRLRFALGRFGEAIGRIAVRLSDENGPRGGADKTVRLTASVRPAIHLTVRETAAVPEAAVAVAADRLARQVQRHLERRREHRAVGFPRGGRWPR